MRHENAGPASRRVYEECRESGWGTRHAHARKEKKEEKSKCHRNRKMSSRVYIQFCRGLGGCCCCCSTSRLAETIDAVLGRASCEPKIPPSICLTNAPSLSPVISDASICTGSGALGRGASHRGEESACEYDEAEVEAGGEGMAERCLFKSCCCCVLDDDERFNGGTGGGDMLMLCGPNPNPCEYVLAE